MVGAEYLENILLKYEMSEEKKKKIDLIKNHFYSEINKWANNCLVNFSYSGSFAKGTNVNGSTDVDFFISLSSITNGSLKEIYDSLLSFLEKKDYKPRKQNVSIGINYDGYKIDFVPAKKIDQYSDDHNLYSNRTGNWIKTNITKHISYINDYKRKKETKLTKIWRNIHSLDFPSFYIELSIISALLYKANDIESNFQTILGYLSTDFINARIVDPSNSNNVVSDVLFKYEKQSISDKAKESNDSTTWNNVIW